MTPSEQNNLDTIQSIYAAFNRGDINAILDRVADDVSWRSHLDPVIPWSGDFSGKSQVVGFFEAIAGATDIDLFEAQDWVTQADTVVSAGRFAGKSRTHAKPFDTRWIFVWKLRDGQVQSYEQFHQAELANAFR